MSVSWDYYDKFRGINEKYLLPRGEGDTIASQIITAVNKLIYKWYNDGDVFDNTYTLKGWCNDLSSYANWLYHNSTPKAAEILDRIEVCNNDDDYENLLKDLADELFNEELLSKMETQIKVGSIYECNGPFEFDDSCDDEYEDEEYEEEDEEY